MTTTRLSWVQVVSRPLGDWCVLFLILTFDHQNVHDLNRIAPAILWEIFSVVVVVRDILSAPDRRVATNQCRVANRSFLFPHAPFAHDR